MDKSEYKRILTLGSNVDVEHAGSVERMVVHGYRANRNDVVIESPGSVPPVKVDDCNIDTVSPPSLDFIRNMARDWCGAAVEEMDEGPNEDPYIQISTEAWTINIWDSEGLDRYRSSVAAISALGMAYGPPVLNNNEKE